MLELNQKNNLVNFELIDNSYINFDSLFSPSDELLSLPVEFKKILQCQQIKDWRHRIDHVSALAKKSFSQPQVTARHVRALSLHRSKLFETADLAHSSEADKMKRTRNENDERPKESSTTFEYTSPSSSPRSSVEN